MGWTDGYLDRHLGTSISNLQNYSVGVGVGVGYLIECNWIRFLIIKVEVYC